jgi:hypothetical protein
VSEWVRLTPVSTAVLLPAPDPAKPQPRLPETVLVNLGNVEYAYGDATGTTLIFDGTVSLVVVETPEQFTTMAQRYTNA